jgi:uncharacterized protein involved in type VI secretion and phage assembly
MSQYFGKYRATVTNNTDPLMRGRLMLKVPDVPGFLASIWAEACVPLAGPAGPPMGIYLVPPVGTGVWVEFEKGDPGLPVWVGCRWGGSAEIPPLSGTGLAGSPNIVIQSEGQHSIVISDLPGPGGGLILKSKTGASIIINDTGIFIQNGKGAGIILEGPSVNINNGAFTVT